MDSDKRMIETQARLITRLNKEIAEMQIQFGKAELEIERLRPAHDYYMMIQRYCLENDSVFFAWQNFITVLKIATDDAEGENDRVRQHHTYFSPSPQTAYPTTYDPGFTQDCALPLNLTK
jgi:hypothetical protein